MLVTFLLLGPPPLRQELGLVGCAVHDDQRSDSAAIQLGEKLTDKVVKLFVIATIGTVLPGTGIVQVVQQVAAIYREKKKCQTFVLKLSIIILLYLYLWYEDASEYLMVQNKSILCFKAKSPDNIVTCNFVIQG